MSEVKREAEIGIDQTVRQRLLAKATALFARKGYAATTVREIVEAAGVTKPVLYYYFPNKEGIYLELMRDAFSRYDLLLDRAQKSSGTVRERVLYLADLVYQLFSEQIEVAKVGYSIYYGPPQGAPFFDFDAFYHKFHDTVKGLVREGIRRGEFRKKNEMNMTWAILGAVHVAIEVLLCHPEMAMGRKGLGRVLELIFEGISGGEGREKGEKK
jgi:TetR/AcrR family transcriptional regulator